MNIIINGKKIKTKQGKTILSVAKENGFFIPTLCYHPDLENKANCRICVVEVIDKKGKKRLVASCATEIEEGWQIKTETEEIRKLRKTNLELLFSQHQEKCSDCYYNFSCDFKQMAKEYKADISRFQDRKKGKTIYNFGNVLSFDSSKCIDCGNCVEMCQKQAVKYLETDEKQGFFEVVPSRHRQCIYCGQCLTHCPVGAFEAKDDCKTVEKTLKNKKKTVVFQFAPAIRTTLGEEFGMKLGQVVTGKLVAAIRALGCEYVFDVSVGADFTTYEEANELLEKLTNKKPKILLSSCCPSWVRFLELYFPEFVGNLSHARPPHIISGGLIKTYFAQKQGLNPKDIVVVSVMPCVAKKYEIERKELLVGDLKPVDYVLTTSELALMLKKQNINLNKMASSKCDEPLGIPSGAGVIYGASGGVMESALRMAFWKAEKRALPKIIYEQVRGQEQIKKAVIKIKGKTIKMAAVSGTGAAKEILEELKQNPNAYSCVEVMACWGGCVGGGGQPLPTNKFIRAKRAQGLYAIDNKNALKIPSENPIVKKIYKDFLKTQATRQQLCQAKYK